MALLFVPASCPTAPRDFGRAIALEVKIAAWFVFYHHFSRSPQMNPHYGAWSYNSAANYFFKICHYYDVDNNPYIFYMIYHPSYPQYYYCYYPTGFNTGYYWCRCYNPSYPGYSPFYFATIMNAAQFQYPTIEAANPHFGDFSQTPAHYPPSSQLPMQPLPPGLPQG